MKAEYTRVRIVKIELNEAEAKMLKDMMQNLVVIEESTACAKLREDLFVACKDLEN